jgi:hypothetical protein
MHFESDLLLVLVDYSDGETKADDGEIYWRARCRQGQNPPSLAPALRSNAPRAGPCDPARFAHGGHGVVGENVENLRVFSA